jgi:hypothetical protein
MPVYLREAAELSLEQHASQFMKVGDVKLESQHVRWLGGSCAGVEHGHVSLVEGSPHARSGHERDAVATSVTQLPSMRVASAHFVYEQPRPHVSGSPRRLDTGSARSVRGARSGEWARLRNGWLSSPATMPVAIRGWSAASRSWPMLRSSRRLGIRVRVRG